MLDTSYMPLFYALGGTKKAAGGDSVQPVHRCVPPVMANYSTWRQASRVCEPEGGSMNRPRAADDFSAIRSRMEESRRERAQVVAGDDPREVPVPRDHSEAGKPTVAGEPRLTPAVRRRL